MNKALKLLEELVQAFGVRMRCYGEDLDGLEVFDDGLRFRIYQKMDTDIPARFIRGMEPGVMYICGDPYTCRYCLFRFPETAGENERYCVIGPWKESTSEDSHIDDVLKREKIPNYLKGELAQYLTTVPYINPSYILESVLEAGISHLSGKGIRVCRLAEFMDGTVEAYSPKPDTALTKQIIKDRYGFEDALLKAVSEGNAAKAADVHEQARSKYNPQKLWTEDKLRNAKNYSICLDTLLRKAVENGYVHPAHIDAISADFCRRIENAANIPELTRLGKVMIRRYCTLVEQFSLRQYSTLIRNVINLIDFNFHEPLSVMSLAQEFHVNPSNLSTQFRRERGVPLTVYINSKRMEHAASLLRSSGLYIQEIAEQCGFLDTNYFSRLFKRYHGLSPLDFRRKLEGI